MIALDGERELARSPFHWNEGQTYKLRLEVEAARLRAFVDDRILFDLEDAGRPLLTGAIALVCGKERVGRCRDSVAAAAKPSIEGLERQSAVIVGRGAGDDVAAMRAERS